MVDYTPGLHASISIDKGLTRPLINHKQRNIAFVIGLLVTFLPILLIENGVLNHTSGIFMYPVDDTFIHMEVARNLAFHSTWGINGTEFSSASSSILYTVLLAILFKIFSVHTIIPFIVNCIAAIALLWVVSNWLAKQQLKTYAVAVIITAVVLLTPLPIMVISGMEHSLQCLFSFLFLAKTADWLQSVHGKENRETLPWSIPYYALLLTAIRYEGLFLVFAVCVSFLYLKRFRAAFITGIIALLPLIVFGIFSVIHGSYFLPNSVLIKSDEVPLFGRGVIYFVETILVDKLTLSRPGITALAAQRLLLLLPVVYFLFRRRLAERFDYTWLLLVLTITTLLHLALASTGKFYRYEAYLVLCASVVMTTVIAKYYREIIEGRNYIAWFLASILFVILFLPLVLRSAAAFTKAQQAALNIYEQQYQMGKFIHQFASGKTVAANDIGAVSFYSQSRIIDLWGLGNIDIARSRKKGYWTPAFLDSLTRINNTRLAIIYDSWFNYGFSDRWKRIATWQIRNNVVCGDDLVSFYAIDPAYAEELRKDLQQYEAALPKTVSVRYY